MVLSVLSVRLSLFKLCVRALCLMSAKAFFTGVINDVVLDCSDIWKFKVFLEYGKMLFLRLKSVSHCYTKNNVSSYVGGSQHRKFFKILYDVFGSRCHLLIRNDWKNNIWKVEWDKKLVDKYQPNCFCLEFKHKQWIKLISYLIIIIWIAILGCALVFECKFVFLLIIIDALNDFSDEKKNSNFPSNPSVIH